MTEPVSACGYLPLAEAVAMFLPESEGGKMGRTTVWPRPDHHESARRLCSLCPIQAACLREALETDDVTFRCLSPEERAAFGGTRSKIVQIRPVQLTRDEVAGRILDSGYDYDALWRVLVDWDRHLGSLSAKDLVTLRVTPDKVGWSATVEQEGVAAFEMMAARASRDHATVTPDGVPTLF